MEAVQPEQSILGGPGSEAIDSNVGRGKRREFHTLNGLRGVAAALVVLVHNPADFPVHPHHAYLAVDLFFVISGFILSYVYGARLAGRWPTAEFLKARLIRLAPLYLLALGLSAIIVAVDPTNALHRLGARLDLEYLALGSFLIPAHLHGDPQFDPFPYNNVSWTLCLEIFVNCVHCFFLRRVKTTVLLALNGVSAAALLLYYHHHHNLNAGWQYPDIFTIGVIRVLFSYTAGMLLYRLWKAKKVELRVPAWVTVLVAGVALSMPIGHAALAAVLIVLLLLPALVLLSSWNEPGRWFGVLFSQLGAASYAVYILHGPVFYLYHRFAPVAPQVQRAFGFVMLVVLIAISLVVDRIYDTPTREWLRTKLQPSANAVTQELRPVTPKAA